ncbi:MAG: rhomboid family intramembrane serine protease [Bacteriovoracaceae bacterium]|nr:rhomboid family intramembrane serine protease [Bacteriovoracaceae bacterium]
MERLIDPFYKSQLINSIILVNVGVFLAWQYSFFQGGLQFMAENFLVSWQALEQGRIWTALTSVFSHNAFFHIFINMFVLNSFGVIVIQVTKTKPFLIFYLIAGLAGSLIHSFTSAFLLDEPALNALGASGAIAGIILLFALMFPQKKILLLGIIPIRAIWGALMFVGIDLWGLVAQTKGGGLPIGHGAHLGGALIGVIYFIWLRKKFNEEHYNLVG